MYYKETKSFIQLFKMTIYIVEIVSNYEFVFYIYIFRPILVTVCSERIVYCSSCFVKDGNVLFNDALITFYFYGYMASEIW